MTTPPFLQGDHNIPIGKLSELEIYARITLSA
jgi:hypothetical protein